MNVMVGKLPSACAGFSMSGAMAGNSIQMSVRILGCNCGCLWYQGQTIFGNDTQEI